MGAESGISLEDFLGALTRRGVPLPFEIGTFIALELCETVARAPAQVVPSVVGLDDEGRIGVTGATRVGDEAACRALVVLLGDLLVRSAPGVPAMLLQVVERGPGQGEWTLARLRDDLEAALVPLNRAATRRVLARLVREARRDDGGPATRISAPPEAAEVDADLDLVLGVTPGGERAAAASSARAPVPDVGRPMGASDAPARAVREESERREHSRPELEAGLSEFERAASRGRSGGPVAIAIAVGLVVAALAVWFLVL